MPEQRLGYSLGLLGTGQLVGSLIGPIIGGAVADMTGSYRVPFFFAGVVSLMAFLGTWRFVPEHFTRPAGRRQRHSLLAGFALLARSKGLLALIVVMLMAQFATQAVQPVVTLFVQEMLGPRPDLATLGGLAFSVTGIAGVLAVPFLGRKSDVIGYRTVLLISLFGAALFTAPQALSAGLLGVRHGAVRAGLVRRRHFAGGEFADRAADCRGQPRVRLWDGVVGVLSSATRWDR